MISLRLGQDSAVVVPESGSAVAGWMHGPVRLLRMPLTEAVLHGDVHGMGYFPLLPYANRIGQGRFTWEGQSYQLHRNIPGHPHALHGVGWARPWQIEALSDVAITLSLHHEPDADWPFAFDAEHRIELRPHALRLSLRLRNRHAGPVPAGLGFHPYFPRGTGATLRFEANRVWHTDTTLLAVAESPIPPEWDHRSGRSVGSVVLDNCFGGWPHRAEIAWSSHSLTIEADPLLGFLQVYTPPGQPFFAVEPVSHAPDDINRGGMRILGPGETIEGSILLTASLPT